jgi:hypothetical protein
MPKSFTIAAASGAYGFLVGLFLPGLVVYSVLYFRRNGRHLKTLWRLCGRLFLGAIVVGGFGMGMMLLIKFAGGSEDLLVESPSYMRGFVIGLCAAIVALIVGRYRARRHDAAVTR